MTATKPFEGNHLEIHGYYGWPDPDESEGRDFRMPDGSWRWLYHHEIAALEAEQEEGEEE